MWIPIQGCVCPQLWLPISVPLVAIPYPVITKTLSVAIYWCLPVPMQRVTHPVLYRRMVKAKQDNPNLKVVVIDPRRTATYDLADLHLAIAPGSDNFIFSGLLHYLSANGLTDKAYIDKYTQGFAKALESVAMATLDKVSQTAQISSQDLQTFYQWFAETEKAITFYSQGINQSATGTDKCNAIINCHLATGKLGKAGMGPFSITGQPNAMGGREVGGWPIC